jgi:hypothetical protein
MSRRRQGRSPGEAEQAHALATVNAIRRDVARASGVPELPLTAPPRNGAEPDLLLAPVSDQALRVHLLTTIRCVRQRSLTDFLL